MRRTASRTAGSGPRAVTPARLVDEMPIAKVIVVGEPMTGKTSIAQRYTYAACAPNYKATVGVDFFSKIVNEGSRPFQLQMWDLAGQERFNAMTHIYYREALLCILVFDVTSRRSFEKLQQWRNQLNVQGRLSDGRPIPCVLIGNKCDVDPIKWSVTEDNMDEFCARNDIAKWFLASAKEGINVDEAMGFVVESLAADYEHLRRPPTPAQLSETVVLQATSLGVREGYNGRASTDSRASGAGSASGACAC